MTQTSTAGLTASDASVSDAASTDQFVPAAELQIDDLETIKLLTDPLRMRIMESFARLGGKPLTVKRIAAQLGESATKLYYHVNLLEERGLLRAVGSRLVSGIVETSYLPVARSFKVGRPLFSMSPPDAEETLSAALLAVLDGTRSDVLESVRAGVIDHSAEPAPGHRLIVAKLSVSLTPARAAAFAKSVERLVAEADVDDTGDGVLAHGLTVCFYPLAGAAKLESDDEH